MVPMFGRSVPELCKITQYAINHIYNNHIFRLQSWNQTFLSPENLESYANAINVKGSPLLTCFGFIDGTVRPICRPRVNQIIVYNGHKRLHAIKFQSICIPNDLIANLSGPWGESFILPIINTMMCSVLNCYYINFEQSHSIQSFNYIFCFALP
jgi:hypothetical protein